MKAPEGRAKQLAAEGWNEIDRWLEVVRSSHPSLGETGFGERVAKHLQENDEDSEESTELVSAVPKFENFFLKREHVHIEDLGRDNLGAS